MMEVLRSASLWVSLCKQPAGRPGGGRTGGSYWGEESCEPGRPGGATRPWWHRRRWLSPRAGTGPPWGPLPARSPRAPSALPADPSPVCRERPAGGGQHRAAGLAGAGRTGGGGGVRGNYFSRSYPRARPGRVLWGRIGKRAGEEAMLGPGDGVLCRLLEGAPHAPRSVDRQPPPHQRRVGGW